MERSEELEELIRSWFAAATSGDAAVVDRHVSRETGVLLIGSDPDEWLSSGEDIVRFLTPSSTRRMTSGGSSRPMPR